MIRVVWGSAIGPTAVAAYDGALADANLGDYNLVHLSSIVPAGVPVEATGTAPDLGPPGNCLPVVEARATVQGPGTATAGLAWATGEGPGLFYEASGTDGEAAVRGALTEGLDAGMALRDWSFDIQDRRVERIEVTGDTFGVAVVLAAFGDSEPVV